MSNPNVVRGARRGSNRRGFYLLLLLVAVVGVGAISWAMNRSGSASAAIVVPPAAALPPGAARPEGYVLGSATAPVEIVEYADFECPGCAQFATLHEPDVRSRLVNTGQARFRFYDFQVNGSHRNSPAASLAAACANDQGKFWEMHDRIFAGQDEWRTPLPGYDGGTDDPKPVLAGYAQAVGVDMGRWNQCYDSRQHLNRIAQHAQEAGRAQVRSTPTVIVGNRLIQGGPTYDAIKALVDSTRATAATAAPAAARQ